MLANHRPGYIRVRGLRVEIERGQVGHSEVTLSARWQWSRDKVRRFMHELEQDSMITAKRDSKISIITITNYDQYQDSSEADDTADKTAKNTADRQQTRQQTDTNKNVKNEKKEDKGNTPLTPRRGEERSETPKRERKGKTSLPFADAFADFWAAYPRKVAKPNAEKAWAKLVKENALPDMDTLLAAVANQAEANDWARDNGRFCPHPATWLNARRWEDSAGVSKPQGTSWHKYRSWASGYIAKRAAMLSDTPQPTSELIDAGAQILAEWIAPDGFSETEAAKIITWILSRPERARHVPSLFNLADEVPRWGFVISWASNGSKGIDVGDSPKTEAAANG